MYRIRFRHLRDSKSSEICEKHETKSPGLLAAAQTRDFSSHNADFRGLRISKMPANASGTTIRLLRWFWLRYNTRWSVNYKKDFVYIKMN